MRTTFVVVLALAAFITAEATFTLDATNTFCGFVWTDDGTIDYDRTVDTSSGTSTYDGVIGFSATGSDSFVCQGFGCTCTLHTICTDTAMSIGCQTVNLVYTQGNGLASLGASSFQSYTSSNVLDNAGVTGDPHVYGFNGERFTYNGFPGAVSNFFSSPGLQINSKIVRFEDVPNATWMGQLGVLTKFSKIVVDSDGTMEVNGNLLEFGQSISTDDVNVTYSQAKESNFKWRVAQTEIIADSFKLEVVIRKSPQTFNNQFLDFTFKPRCIEDDVDGILGFTLRNSTEKASRNIGKSNGIKLKEKDYVVKNGIFGTDFVFNCFKNHPGCRKVFHGSNKEGNVSRRLLHLCSNSLHAGSKYFDEE